MFRRLWQFLFGRPRYVLLLPNVKCLAHAADLRCRFRDDLNIEAWVGPSPDGNIHAKRL